ncbi:MAG: GTPase RsgA, partial [Clostridia bacterium]|nr:GTPase RsgA [Clostridia bacterium]
MSKEISMAHYGLTEEIEESAKQFADLTVARVISQEKGLYRLIFSTGEKHGEISGSFLYNIQSKSEFPAVGDFVMADRNNNGGNAVIRHVLPRKSSFIRKAAGEKNEEQVVAANIDTVFLCMSLNRDFNIRRLERYVSIAFNSGAEPVIILTKSDLCDELEQKIAKVASVAVATDIVVTNAVNENG